MDKLKDIIRNNGMSTRPEYYSGRDAIISDLNEDILFGIHKDLKKEFGINGISFFDDTFTVNYNWVKEFCNALKKENIDLPVSAIKLEEPIKETGEYEIKIELEHGIEVQVSVVVEGVK